MTLLLCKELRCLKTKRIKGFAGLSGMVSDGTVPVAEPTAPAKYSVISLTKSPRMSPTAARF